MSQLAIGLLVAAASALLALAPAAAAPTPQASGQPSEALCTAHYDQQSRQLARRIVETAEASRSPLQAELRQLLRKGTAFVGHAYLESTPEAEAKAQLEQAKLDLARLKPAELQRIVPICDSMANALRKDAPAWQRVIADRLAERRAERLVKSAAAQAEDKKGQPAGQ